MSGLVAALGLTLGVVLSGCDPETREHEEREELMRTQRDAIRSVTIARDRAAHRIGEARRQAGDDIEAVEREAQDDIDEAAADVRDARESRAAREHLDGRSRLPASEVVPPPAGGI